MTRIAALLTLLTLAAQEASQAADSFSFRHISMEDGLSNNKVNSIWRDSQGFVWFSTSCGLNRYDGYTMTVFLHSDEDSTSLDDNTVLWVRDLADDRLLVRTNRSYSTFDKRSETFRPAAPMFDAAHVRWRDAVTFVDSRGDIWMSDGPSCSVYSASRGATTHRGLSGGSATNVCSMCEAGGDVYIIHYDGTIGIYATDAAGTWQRKAAEETPLGADNHRIFVDSGGDYWVAGQDRYGLWHKAAQSGQWTRLTNESPEPLRIPDFVVRDVTEDSRGRIWVASDHGGISVIDRRGGTATSVRSQKNHPRSLRSNGISCLYADRQGVVWVGDVSMGASYFAEPIFKFDVDNLQVDSLDPNFVAQVNAIAEDEQGGMWYGTNENGLLHEDRMGRRRLFRSSERMANSLSSDIVVSLCPDGDGGLWVGTFLGGLCHYDGHGFSRYRNRPDIPPAAASDNVWTICRDDGRLWVGSLSAGIAVLDERSGAWTKIDRNDGLPNGTVSKIVPMRDGRMAVGTSDGLCVVDTRNGNQIIPVDDTAGRLKCYVIDLFYDSRDLLWVCSNNGVHIVDGKTLDYIRHMGRAEGLPTDATLGVVEDRQRGIWIATAGGMTSVEVRKDDRNGVVNTLAYNYNDQDGFLTGSINERAIACTSDGEIVVGRDNGVNRFNPASISYNKEIPHVRFTSLSTFGSPARIGGNGDYSLPQAMPFCESIDLPHDVNMFTVFFSTMSSVLPEKVTYTYRLDGFTDSWISSNSNHATYTNLAPGRYRLLVRASNSDGLESAEASVLGINVLPPWWRTGWAYALYACAVAAALFFSVKWIRDRDKARFKMRQMMDEVEKQKQVDDMKLRFFTNISHELRTPLSLIVSPLENILEETPADAPHRRQMELIYRNSQKLLSMVNQLLDFRKVDKGGMTLNLSEGDLVGFVGDHCDAFVKLSTKDINFVLDSSEPSIYLKFDKDKIGKVIDNLLSNAYKFTPVGGNVTMGVGLSPDHTRAIISVGDNGIGIADEHKAHIFERFYQVPQEDSSLAGSGIGLHMVKEFVALHKGTIRVEDNIGGGSVFTIELPTSPDTAQKTAATAEPEQTIVTASPAAQAPTTNKKGGRKTIAIVDDNEDFLALLHDTLQKDYDIVEAHNGAEAYETVTATPPDLIITDVMMPVMDGNELCSKIKGDIRTSHIPLIMLTAKSAEEHNIEGLKLGADDYLTKPFNPQILRLKIKRLTDMGEKRHQAFKNQIDPEPSQITITPLDEKLIQKAIAYVEENIVSSTLSVEDLSRHLGMSRVHLYKKLMSITGRPPIEFIRVIRLKRAAQLLHDPAQNVADVAYAVGFNNPKYFSKYFKEEFGVLPSKYCQTQTEEKGMTASTHLTE